MAFQPPTSDSGVSDLSAPITDTPVSMTKCTRFPKLLHRLYVSAHLALHLHIRQFSLKEWSTLLISIRPTPTSTRSSASESQLAALLATDSTCKASRLLDTQSPIWKIVCATANGQTNSKIIAAPPLASILPLQIHVPSIAQSRDLRTFLASMEGGCSVWLLVT
jgi:hypothetical protein